MDRIASYLTASPTRSRLLIALAALLLLRAQAPAQQTGLVALALPALAASIPAAPTLKPQPPLIVVGFAGGFIKRTSIVHGEVSLATQLREKYGAAIHSAIFENHHGEDAHREILRLIQSYDIKRSEELSSFAVGGQPAPSSSRGPASVVKQDQPRIILYGHSWGASEAVAVARQLQRDGVPVQLVIQVDSVPKRSSADDGLIPANVAQAINFYQSEGLLHGRPVIHAADPAATKILGNIQLTYKHNDIPTPGYPWFARTFTKRHIEIENDPRVWTQVEALITANLPPIAP